MGHKFAAIAFTEEVKSVQQEQGSRAGYANMEQGQDFNHLLSSHEADFIQSRDSFYMASVSETDWPYVQHRGGPVGFMRVLDEQTIGFADFSGNRQYVSTGNFRKNDRVAIIFMDYANRTRLKLLGRVSIIAENDWETLSRLEDDSYRAQVERGFLIHVEAFDWNCPQHITPRYTDAEVEQLMAPLLEENEALKAAGSSVQKFSPAQLGDGPLVLVISGIRQLTPRVRAFEFRDPDGADLPPVEAGSHLQVPVMLENGEIGMRHYSICSNPARRDVYEIAVLREEEGSGGSLALHNSFELGQVLHCELPKNHFSLHDDNRPAVLIAGGIGITPIKAMAQVLKARGTAVSFHYSGRSRKEMAFRDRLEREFGDQLAIYSSADNERMGTSEIIANAPHDAVFYICGPDRLIDAVVREGEVQGIDPERIRYEKFTATIADDAKPIVVQLSRSDIQLTVSANETVLDAMLDAGIDMPYSCKAGNCRTCAVKVVDGEVEHKDTALSEFERNDQKLMCPCVSRASTEHLILDI